MEVKIGITGHRENKIDNFQNKKFEIINNLKTFLIENKYKFKDIVFNLGGANGFDSLVGKFCIDNSIKYDLYLPFVFINNQIIHWTDNQKKEFYEILKLARNINYGKGFFDRNRKIVDNSEVIISYFNEKDEKKSGTGYTVDYARKNNKLIINLF